MDAIVVKNRMSLLEQVHSTNPPTQPGSLPKEVKVMFLARLPSLQKARRFDKGGTAHQSAKSNFCSTASLTNSYFYPSCNQDCLRKILLITAKAVSLRAEQNNNSN